MLDSRPFWTNDRWPVPGFVWILDDMWATLTVVLVVLMCAVPLALLARDIGVTLRRRIELGDPPPQPVAPPAPVIYVASRPVQPLR